VTPSSKCVGDLALYLVLKGLKTNDLIDPVTNEIQPNATLLDFPQSVIGLLKGELGFPHRGFPKKVEELILKGNLSEKLTIRAGLVLPPVDFVQTIATLSTKWNKTITAEEGMSYLMYPSVFSDYMKRQQAKGPLLTTLPTEAYFYGLNAGDIFDMWLSADQLGHLFTVNFTLPENVMTNKEGKYLVRVELSRISSILQQHRTVYFKLSLLQASDSNTVVYSESQQTNVKDTGGVFVFEGPMVDTKKPMKEIGSPMSGIVEKVLVTVGQVVTAGDVLCVVSAMKMEVKVSAPCDGIVGGIAVPAPGKCVLLCLSIEFDMLTSFILCY